MTSLYRMKRGDGNEIRLSELYDYGRKKMICPGTQSGQFAAATHDFAPATRKFTTATLEFAANSGQNPRKSIAGVSISRIRSTGLGGPFLVGRRQGFFNPAHHNVRDNRHEGSRNGAGKDDRRAISDVRAPDDD